MIAALPAAWRATPARDRALALWALTSIDEHDELQRRRPAAARPPAWPVHRAADGRDLDDEVIAARYAFLDASSGRAHARRSALRKRQASERIDWVLLHPVWGFATFLAVMLVVFQSLFSWATRRSR